MKVNPKAFQILSEPERMALGLQLGLAKSTWESGEIMGKSHYKYLEIKYRAEEFLKMFAEFYKLYDKVLPGEVLEGQKYVITYLSLCLEDRMKPFDAFEKIKQDNKKLTKNLLNTRIVEVLKHWENTSRANPHHGLALSLVKQFDRWNNFRILPKEIQEPSAFKRRLNKGHKKYLKVLVQIPQLSLDKIKELYEVKSKTAYYYWPYLDNKTYTIIKVKATKGSLQCFTQLSLYLFKDKAVAEEYIKAAYSYLVKHEKDCKDGLDFWPQYRELIKKSINYEPIQNIIPQRKYLNIALKNLQFI